MLTTRRIATEVDLAALEQPWNQLADGEPLRSWDWLATWWKHYAALGDRSLCVLAVYKSDQVVGIAPWYVDRSRRKGRVIRALGDGHVCTDHVTILCRNDDNDRVSSEIARYLGENDDWDCLELEAVDEGDVGINTLLVKLEGDDCFVSRRFASNYWQLDLPADWDSYMKMVSHSHRRQLRKCDRESIQSGRAKLHLVRDASELQPAWDIFVDLHQRRWKSLGEPGCFASPAFGNFHREVAEQLLVKGQLRLAWIEFDGVPLAAEYHVASRDTIYTYQSGLDVSRLQDSPGRIAYLLTIRRAINEGFKYVDFMRGDEIYKAHFRAEAHRQFNYRAFPNRPIARLCGQLTCAGLSVKDWVKQGVAAVMS